MFSKKKGPIYLQIKDEIKERILSGVYPIDSKIPTESELETEFAVSKITIRRAVEELAQEGFLHKQSGKGTQVISNRAFTKLSKGQNFTELLIAEGYQVSKNIISVETLSLPKDHPLHQHFNGQCLLVTRCFNLDHRPYIYFRHYLPTWIHFQANAWENNDSIYSLMAHQGINFQTFTDEFDVEINAEEICQALKVPNKPLLKRIRYSFDENNRCVEYSEAFYDTGLHRYVVKMET